MEVNFKVSIPDNCDDSQRNNIIPKYTSALDKLVMPYIGVFWDIENVRVPKEKSVSAFVHKIRQNFFPYHREYDIIVVLDTAKESKSLIKDLLASEVTIIYIDACNKNAADDKLQFCIRKFFELISRPATLILITADIDFKNILHEAKNSHFFRTILIHKQQVHPALTMFADECYSVEDFSNDLPNKDNAIARNLNLDLRIEQKVDLVVSNLPITKKACKVKFILNRLACNTGGRVVSFNRSRAIVQFKNRDSAARAKTRMHGEKVLKRKISVDFKGCSSNASSSYGSSNTGYNNQQGVYNGSVTTIAQLGSIISTTVSSSKLTNSLSHGVKESSLLESQHSSSQGYYDMQFQAPTSMTDRDPELGSVAYKMSMMSSKADQSALNSFSTSSHNSDSSYLHDNQKSVLNSSNLVPSSVSYIHTSASLNSGSRDFSNNQSSHPKYQAQVANQNHNTSSGVSYGVQPSACSGSVTTNGNTYLS